MGTLANRVTVREQLLHSGSPGIMSVHPKPPTGDPKGKSGWVQSKSSSKWQSSPSCRSWLRENNVKDFIIVFHKVYFQSLGDEIGKVTVILLVFRGKDHAGDTSSLGLEKIDKLWVTSREKGDPKPLKTCHGFWPLL